VERSDASEETRGKPQAKETHGELQAAPPCQGHELESANDGLWQPISTGSKHKQGRYDTKVAIDVISVRAAAARSLHISKLTAGDLQNQPTKKTQNLAVSLRRHEASTLSDGEYGYFAWGCFPVFLIAVKPAAGSAIWQFATRWLQNSRRCRSLKRNGSPIILPRCHSRDFHRQPTARSPIGITLPYAANHANLCGAARRQFLPGLRWQFPPA
jgi:hypothetical protein